MPTPSVADATRWIESGTALCELHIRGLDQISLNQPSLLPEWTRAHVVAHLIGNAEGIARLLTWAATGVESPMYASRERRNADIAERSLWAASDLHARFVTTAADIDSVHSVITVTSWQTTITAGQYRDGSDRVVPARVVPWMRAREVMVHAIDLGTGLTFADLPHDFLIALADDIVARRTADHPASSGPDADDGVGPSVLVQATDADWQAEVPSQSRGAASGQVVVSGTLAEVVAYLAGRTTPDAAPQLPAWL